MAEVKKCIISLDEDNYHNNKNKRDDEGDETLFKHNTPTTTIKNSSFLSTQPSFYWKTSRTLLVLGIIINNISTILARRLHQEQQLLYQAENVILNNIENSSTITSLIDYDDQNNNNQLIKNYNDIKKITNNNYIITKIINNDYNYNNNNNNYTSIFLDENNTLFQYNNNNNNNNNVTTLQTFNSTLEEPLSDFILMGVTSVVLGIMILITVIGNVFVIAAILLERNLQNVANYLIVSLAVADLMVACLVMPLGAVYEISRGWILGPELCDMWTSSDVLCCTASILHLVAIAVDRYWAVTNVDYIHTRNGTRIVTMIVVVWSVALVVSLAPQFGWKDPDYLDRINIQQRCLVSQDIGYQIFATCSTFYVPLLVILVLYWKIFQTARKRIRRRRQQRNAVLETTKVNLAPATGSSTTQSTGTSKSHKTLHFFTKNRFIKMRRCRNKSDDPQQQAALVLIEGHSQSQSTDEVLQEEENSHHELNIKDIDESEVDKNNELNIATNTTDNAQTTAFTISNHMTTTTNQINTPVNVSPEKSSGATATTNNGSAGHQPNDQQMRCSTITTTPQQKTQQPISHIDKPVHQPTKRDLKKESLEAKRERKAAKTLAIITGAFVVCWLPFFIMALLMPLCDACYINDYLSSFFLWLGYFNSTLNPVIYTIFSPEFRQAFKRMLCGVSHNRNRGRKLR